VNIQSSPDTGTLVEIYIPATTEMRTSKADGNLVSASSKRTGRTLLLVEDDDGVRRAIEMLLSRSGFDVTSAWDGATAMEYLKTNAAPDVLLTDLSMPGQLQGMDLARHVWKEMPQTSIVVMSGYAEETENDIGVPFLEKPVSQAALISTINNCLNDRARETQAH
jgi:two-component system cell cycle sensor histidine kinase/response regulator CckA